MMQLSRGFSASSYLQAAQKQARIKSVSGGRELLTTEPPVPFTSLDLGFSNSLFLFFCQEEKALQLSAMNPYWGS